MGSSTKFNPIISEDISRNSSIVKKEKEKESDTILKL